MWRQRSPGQCRIPRRDTESLEHIYRDMQLDIHVYQNCGPQVCGGRGGGGVGVWRGQEPGSVRDTESLEQTYRDMQLDVHVYQNCGPQVSGGMEEVGLVCGGGRSRGQCGTPSP